MADCVYYITEPPLFSIDEIPTEIKKFELQFVEKKKDGKTSKTKRRQSIKSQSRD